MTRYTTVTHKIRASTPADVPVARLPVIELSESEFERAEEIAGARSQSYEEIDGGRVCGDQSSQEAHLTGAVGEVAFASATGSRVDRQIYDDGDGGFDFRFGDMTIDTKTTATHIDRPSLLVPAKPAPEADVYILLHRIGTCTVQVLGYASRAVVTDRSPIRHPGKRRNYVIPQTELRLPPGVAEDLAAERHQFAGNL